MRVLVAPDSFKGSLKSREVAAAMARGVLAADPAAEVVLLPVGDGGEGTLEALAAATGAGAERCSVQDPLGRQIEARWLLLPDGETAFVEMAEASGLSRLTPAERDPLRATTFGTGQLLTAALAAGRRRILLGIGGSATNDGGAGALAASGVRFLDRQGRELPPGGAALADLETLDLSGFRLDPELELTVACDVTNPLTGPDGASAIYGPQKGAGPEEIRRLDAALERFADVAARTLGVDHRNAPGAGAAGGLGFACIAFLGARLARGAEMVLDAVGFRDAVRGADLVLTGEGRIDRQTLEFGKTLTAVAGRGREAGVPVIALAGGIHASVRREDYRSAGLASVFSVVPGPMALEEAMANAAALVESAACRAVEVFRAGQHQP